MLRRNRNHDSCEKKATVTENTRFLRIPAGICNLGLFSFCPTDPPRLPCVAVVADNWRFGQAAKRRRQRRPRGQASSSGGQSVPNINCTMTFLSCSLSLLVSVIVVVSVILLKCVSIISSSVGTLLPLLPSQSSHTMNCNDIDRGH